MRYRFIFETEAVEVNASNLAAAYYAVDCEIGQLRYVECGVEPFTSPRTHYHIESYDEFTYRFEFDEDEPDYDKCLRRCWINTKMDQSGMWIEIPVTYHEGQKNSPFAAVYEYVADKLWNKELHNV